MNSNLFLFIFMALLSACQVSQEVASVNASKVTNSPNMNYSITLSEDGWKKKNDLISVVISSSKILFVSGTPYIQFNLAGEEKKLNYVSGSGTTDLTFSYTVTNTDYDIDGIEINSYIELNGGSVYHVDSGQYIQADLNLNLPYYSIPIDGISPELISITPLSNDFYNEGDQIKLELNFSESVIKTDAFSGPTLALGEDDSVQTIYSSGHGSNKIVVVRTVTSSDFDIDGEINLNSFNFGSTLTDLAGNPIANSIEETIVNDIYINYDFPTITQVNLPTDGTYNEDDELEFEIVFNQNVAVTGNPLLKLKLNSAIKKATYSGKTASNTLKFIYKVKVGDVANNGIELISSLDLTNGTIKSTDDLEVDAKVVIPAQVTTGIKLSAPVPPRVLLATPPLPGLYKLGETIDFTLFFDQPITVDTTSGTPRIPVYVGSLTKQALYQGMSGTQGLIFRYTVTSTDADSDGIVLSSIIESNGGSIIDSNTQKEVTFSFIPPLTSGVNVDGAAPVILSTLVTPSSANLGKSKNVDLYLTFNEPVKVSGIPTIDLILDSSTTVQAIYTSGTETNQLLFRYVIQENDFSDGNISFGTQVDIPAGGFISDNYGNQHTSSVLFTAPPTAIVIDAVSPSINSATLASNTNLKNGDTYGMNLTFSEEVSVTGKPHIACTVGTEILNLAFSSIDTTKKILTFSSLLVGNFTDIDGVSCNGVISGIDSSNYIKDLFDNPVTNFNFNYLNDPNIIIDTTSPYVTSVTPPAGGTYKAGDVLNFYLNWSEDVTITGTPQLTLMMNGVEQTLNYTSGTSEQSLFQYTIPNNVNTHLLSLNPTIKLNGATIKDINGLSNDAKLTFTSPLLWNIIIDSIQPEIKDIYVTEQTKTYYKGQNATIHIHMSEPVSCTNPEEIKLDLDVGGFADIASFDSDRSNSNVMVFNYTVPENVRDDDGITVTDITLNNGNIEDLAGNALNANFTEKNLPQIKINGFDATVTEITPPNSRTYYKNDILNFYITFDRDVYIENKPRLKINFNPIQDRYASYVSGSGSKKLLFQYKIISNDHAFAGVKLEAPIELDDGESALASIKDEEGNDANLSINLLRFRDVIVDTLNESEKLLATFNKTRYYLNNDINLSVEYPDIVNVTNSPEVEFEIGGETKKAVYTSGSGTNTLIFRYSLQSNDPYEFEGLILNPYMNSGPNEDGDIKLTNDTSVLNYPVINKQRVYYYPPNLFARYKFDPDFVKTTTCDSNICLDSTQSDPVLDLSGNNNHIQDISNVGPVISKGFGTNNAYFMQFNNLSFIELPFVDKRVSAIYFVMRTPTDTVAGPPGKVHRLMYSNDENYISLRSSYESSEIFDVTTSFNSILYIYDSLSSNKYEDQATAFGGTSEGSSWQRDKEYILYFKPEIEEVNDPNDPANDDSFYILNISENTIIGGDLFNGQIAEILIFDEDPFTNQLGTDPNPDNINSALQRVYQIE